ncbi:hypothetical protein HKD37_18G050056 [Glycine soja]
MTFVEESSKSKDRPEPSTSNYFFPNSVIVENYYLFLAVVIGQIEEEVISSDNDENMSIIFPKIECLVLKVLPKLVSFCQQSETFDWPNLQILRVSNISSMETYSRANLNTPLLRSVHITFAKKLWLGNLNDTISYMHKNPAKREDPMIGLGINEGEE